MSELEVVAIEVINKGTHRGKKKVQPQQIHEQIISELWIVSTGLIYMELESLVEGRRQRKYLKVQ